MRVAQAPPCCQEVLHQPKCGLGCFRQIHLARHACSAVIVPVNAPHGQAVLESSHVWSVPPRC